jgi:hypothetical protein
VFPPLGRGKHHPPRFTARRLSLRALLRGEVDSRHRSRWASLFWLVFAAMLAVFLSQGPLAQAGEGANQLGTISLTGGKPVKIIVPIQSPTATPTPTPATTATPTSAPTAAPGATATSTTGNAGTSSSNNLLIWLLVALLVLLLLGLLAYMARQRSSRRPPPGTP